MTWKIEFSCQALKDAKKLRAAKLDKNIKSLLVILKDNPFTPPYEKLSGDLKGYYSRRITIQHRLVYAVHEAEQTIKVVSVWSHYE